MIQFLKTKEEMPDFDEYVKNRKDYVEQIWVNVWVNKATSTLPRYEKKHYLEQRGFNIDGVDKKTINKLFRQEIKSYQPFPVEAWVIETYSDQHEKWRDMFSQARELYKQELEKMNFKKSKQKLIDELTDDAQKIIGYANEKIYLKIRKLVADKLKRDFETNIKYEWLDPSEIEERLLPLGSFQRYRV